MLYQSGKQNEKIDYLNLGLEKAIDCVAAKENMITSIESTKEHMKSQLNEQFEIVSSLKLKYNEIVSSKKHEIAKLISTFTVLKSEKDCHDEKLGKCNIKALEKVDEILTKEGNNVDPANKSCGIW